MNLIYYTHYSRLLIRGMSTPIRSTIYSVAYCPWRGTIKTTTLLYEDMNIYETIFDFFKNKFYHINHFEDDIFRIINGHCICNSIFD